MDQHIALSITREQEKQILADAATFDGRTITSISIEGIPTATIVGKKECGATGGAILELGSRPAEATSTSQNETATAGDATTDQATQPKKYMAKVMFGSKDKIHHYYKNPNSRTPFRSLCSMQSRAHVNQSVMQEFIALRLAHVIEPSVAPEAKLGIIDGERPESRLFLMTEIAGQEGGEEFHTLDNEEGFGAATKPSGKTEITQSVDTSKKTKIPKAAWQTAFAISVGLLNDFDVNKDKNIGVVTKNGKKSLCLFDLGHPTPDKFKLDPKTLLPKSTSVLADVLLWLINLFIPLNSLPSTFKMAPEIKAQLDTEQRAAALQELLLKENEILIELDEMIKAFERDTQLKNAITDMRDKITRRMEYLEQVLKEHNKQTSSDDSAVTAPVQVQGK